MERHIGPKFRPLPVMSRVSPRPVPLRLAVPRVATIESRPRPSIVDGVAEAVIDADTGPFEDYGRRLTAEGGILISFKDLDLRLRQYVWRVSAWFSFTGAEAWYLAHHSPVATVWCNAALALALALINGVILRRPSECRRQLEVRADCLIVEGSEVFWRRHMDVEAPALRPSDDGTMRLCGIYGTRLVEFFTVRRFDEFDRTPEVIEAHLKNAFEQLWSV